ncbi:PAS domain-containing sensor histidine kinase [Psychrosphaera sp.]|nr:PAS domain-containing sensor histidine kinase [Psychrosphaera sp.]
MIRPYYKGIQSHLTVLTSVLLSSAFLSLYFVVDSVLVEWVFILVAAAGVYFCVDKFMELIFKENLVYSNQIKSIFYNEILHQGYNPCLLVSLNDFEVIELNYSANKALTFGPNEPILYLQDILIDKNSKDLLNWLRSIQRDLKYSTHVTNVRIKDRHGKLIPKVSKITAMPIKSFDKRLVIIKIEAKSRVLNISNEPYHLLKNIDITRHAAGTAYWEYELDSNMLFFSSLVAELLGLDDSFKSPMLLSELEEKADCAIFNFAEQMFTGETGKHSFHSQKMIIDRSGNQKFVVMQAHYYETEKVILGTLYDMTAIKNTEIKLRQREQQMNQLIDSIPESILVLQKSKVVFFNRAAVKLFAFNEVSDIGDMPIANFVSDSDKSLLRDRIKYMLAGKKRSYGFTSFKLQKSTGEFFEAEVAVNLIIYDGMESIQFVIRDLTEVLRVRHALAKANFRLSALSAKTLQLIEAERKQIAGELHDDVGQSLTAILLATKWVSRRLDNNALLEKVSDIHDIASQSLDTVRNLSLLLRPAQLDSLGFSPAIKWQMDKLLSIDDIQFEIDDKGFQELTDKQAEIVGFRIVQESLTNIVKHAKAKNVKVKLSSDHEVLIIQVSDDGVGFDVHAQSDSVGLINMKERVELAGGEFKIFSKPLLGTDIKVEIPLRNTFSELESKDAYYGE